MKKKAWLVGWGEISRHTGLHPRTLMELEKTAHLPVTRLGARVVIVPAVLDAWITELGKIQAQHGAKTREK